MAENNYKGIPIPDVIDPPESMQMVLCIPKNRDHMAAFFGALYALTEWNSWEQNGTTDGRDTAAVWWRYFTSWNRNMSDLECEDGMGACCTEPLVIKRVNPTTGNVEQSSNGGTSWTPASGGFQSIIVEPVPPVTSGVAETKCDAATNVQGQVQVWIDQVSNDFTTATTLLEFGLAVIGAIAAAVLAILTDGLLLPLAAQALGVLGAALAAAWGAGKVVFDNYWTTENKDIVFCAAVCTIGDDGSFTDAQFSEFWNRCNSDLPPSPAKMLFMGFLSSVGKQGLNAMAASGTSADSDCSDCSCPDCPDGCTVEWTFFGVTDVVKVSDCTYTMTRDTSLGHFAFTSGDQDLGCYYEQSGVGFASTWPVGSPSASPVNPNTTAIWNYDTGDFFGDGDPMTIHFSSAPFS